MRRSREPPKRCYLLLRTFPTGSTRPRPTSTRSSSNRQATCLAESEPKEPPDYPPLCSEMVGSEARKLRAKFATSSLSTSATIEAQCPQPLSLKRVTSQTGQLVRQESAGRCRARIGGPAFMKLGPQKIPTVAAPTAVARCSGPESLETTTAHRLKRPASPPKESRSQRSRASRFIASTTPEIN